MDKNEYQRIRAYLKSKGETPEMIKATMEDLTSGRTKASSLKIPKDFSHEAKVIKPAIRVKRVKSDLEASYDPKADNVGGDALDAEDVPEEKPKATPVKKKVEAPVVQPKATKGTVVTPKQERVTSTGMKSQDVTQAAPTPRKTQSTKQALALDSQAIIQNEDDKLKTQERAKQGRTRVIKNKSKPMGVDADYWKGLDANQQDELIKGRKAVAVNAPGTPVPSTLEELHQNPNAIKVGEAGSKAKTHRGATPEAPVEAPTEAPKKATVRKVDARDPMPQDAPKATVDDDGFTERYNQRRKAGQSHANATEGAKRDVAKATAPRPASRAPAATPAVDAPEAPRASSVTPDAPEAPRAAPEAPRAAPSAGPSAPPKAPPKVGPVGVGATAAAVNDAVIPDEAPKGILGKAKGFGGSLLRGAGWVGAAIGANEVIPGGLVDAPSNFMAAYQDNEAKGLNAPIPHSWGDVGDALLHRDNTNNPPPVDKPNPAAVVRNNMGISSGMAVEPPLLDVPRTKDNPQDFFKTTGQQVPLTEDNTNFKFSPELLLKDNADKAAGAMNQQPVIPAIVGNAQGQAQDVANTKSDFWADVRKPWGMAYDNIAAGMKNNFQAGIHMAQDPALADAPPQKPTPEHIVAQNPQAAQQKVQQNIAAGIQSGDLSTPKLAQEVAKAENPNASPKQLEQYARQEVAAMRDMNTEEKSNYVAYAMIAAGLLAAAFDKSGAAGDAFGASYNRQLDRNTLLANKKMEQDAASQAAYAQALKDQRELDYKYYNTNTVAGTQAAAESGRNLRAQASDKAKILAAQIRAGGDAAGALKGVTISQADALQTAAILYPDASPEVLQQAALNIMSGAKNSQTNLQGVAGQNIREVEVPGLLWGTNKEYQVVPPRLQ